MPEELKALDELYSEAAEFAAGPPLPELLEFVRSAPRLGAYNAALVRIQRSGCTFVASAAEWRSKYSRDIVPGARPLVILWPFGPVRFVFDVSDTEGEPLPDGILNPFASAGPITEEGFSELSRVLARAGVAYGESDDGPGNAGVISRLSPPRRESFGRDIVEQHYSIVINRNLDVNAKLATVMHELGHLFCGHLGPAADIQNAPDKGVPDRSGCTEEVREFEAESVSWVLCGRLGVDTPSGRYLGNYLENSGDLPDVSAEVIFRAVKRVEAILGDREELGPLLRDDVPRLFRSV